MLFHAHNAACAAKHVATQWRPSVNSMVDKVAASAASNALTRPCVSMLCVTQACACLCHADESVKYKFTSIAVINEALQTQSEQALLKGYDWADMIFT